MALELLCTVATALTLGRDAQEAAEALYRAADGLAVLVRVNFPVMPE